MEEFFNLFIILLKLYGAALRNFSGLRLMDGGSYWIIIDLRPTVSLFILILGIRRFSVCLWFSGRRGTVALKFIKCYV